MAEVQVCRLCLVMNVKLHNLQSYPLQSYFDSILGSGRNIQNTLNLPPYACYECAALVKKFYFFKQKCLRSQAVLQGIKDDCGKFSPTNISAIDRQGLYIASNFKMTLIPGLNIKDFQCSNKDKEENIDKEVQLYSDKEREKNIDTEVHLYSDKDGEENIDREVTLYSDKDGEEIIDREVTLYSDKDGEENIDSELKIYSDKDGEENIDREVTLYSDVDGEENIDREVTLYSDKDGEEKIDREVQLYAAKDREKNKHNEVQLEPVLDDVEAQSTEGSATDEDPVYLVLSSEFDLSSDDEKLLSNYKDQMEEKKGFQVKMLEDPKFAQAKGDISDKPDISKKKSRRKIVKPSRLTEGVSDVAQYTTLTILTMEEQIEEMNKRKWSSNYLKSPHKCEQCFKGFINQSAWKQHVRKHSPSAGHLECKICKFRFKTKRTLYDHSAIHEKRFACKSCSFISMTSTQARRHQEWHNGVIYKCKVCDEMFNKWTSYMNHVRVKHPSAFICGICGNSYASKLGLNLHKRRMHKDLLEEADENKEEALYCAECDVKFLSAEAFKRHMARSIKHTGIEHSITDCGSCGETFNTAEETWEHHREEHKQERRKLRKYDDHAKKPVEHSRWPDKSEHAKVFLENHKGTHFVEERTYKCSQCDRAFLNLMNLRKHEKSHSNSRPYSCSLCLKAFKLKSALSKHIRCHTDEKPSMRQQEPPRALRASKIQKRSAPYTRKRREQRKTRQKKSLESEEE